MSWVFSFELFLVNKGNLLSILLALLLLLLLFLVFMLLFFLFILRLVKIKYLVKDVHIIYRISRTVGEGKHRSTLYTYIS